MFMSALLSTPTQLSNQGRQGERPGEPCYPSPYLIQYSQKVSFSNFHLLHKTFLNVLTLSALLCLNVQKFDSQNCTVSRVRPGSRSVD